MANAEMDAIIHLSDIVLPKGVEIVELSHGEDHDQAVATIHKTRAAVSDSEGEEDGEAESEAATE